MTDIHNNSSTCTQVITVTDNENPGITCASGQSQTADAGVCKAAVTVTAPAASDNCGVASVTNDYNNTSDASGTYPVGLTTVTWTVTDIHNNSSTCTQVIKVTDNENPVAKCKNYTLNLSGGTGTVYVSDIDDGSTDNCGIADMSVSPNTFACSDAGNNKVTLTITDVHGNVSKCDATVTVQYQPTCSISVTPTNNTYTGGVATNIYLGYGPQSATITANASGGSDFSYSWSPSTSLSCSNCQSPVFTPTAEGTYSYTVTITNSNGCKTTCTVNFCVKDVVVSGSGGKKVYLCHVPPGNSSNPQTLSISTSAVPAHLTGHSGDGLNKCGYACQSNKRSVLHSDNIIDEDDLLMVECTPNPYTQTFKLNYRSSSDEDARITIYSITGAMVEQTMLSGYVSEVELGRGLPAGIYVVSFIQGHQNKTIKVIKANN